MQGFTQVSVCPVKRSMSDGRVIRKFKKPKYPEEDEGKIINANSQQLGETLHLLFWLCLRWLAFVFWFILPTSPIVLTLDPPTEY